MLCCCNLFLFAPSRVAPVMMAPVMGGPLWRHPGLQVITFPHFLLPRQAVRGVARGFWRYITGAELVPVSPRICLVRLRTEAWSVTSCGRCVLKPAVGCNLALFFFFVNEQLFKKSLKHDSGHLWSSVGCSGCRQISEVRRHFFFHRL